MSKRQPPRTGLNAVYYQIYTGPGRIELELTRSIYGQETLFSRATIQCRRLLKKGHVYRKGVITN